MAGNGMGDYPGEFRSLSLAFLFPVLVQRSYTAKMGGRSDSFCRQVGECRIRGQVVILESGLVPPLYSFWTCHARVSLTCFFAEKLASLCPNGRSPYCIAGTVCVGVLPKLGSQLSERSDPLAVKARSSLPKECSIARATADQPHPHGVDHAATTVELSAS